MGLFFFLQLHFLLVFPSSLISRSGGGGGGSSSSVAVNGGGRFANVARCSLPPPPPFSRSQRQQRARTEDDRGLLKEERNGGGGAWKGRKLELLLRRFFRRRCLLLFLTDTFLVNIAFLSSFSSWIPSFLSHPSLPMASSPSSPRGWSWRKKGAWKRRPDAFHSFVCCENANSVPREYFY